MKQDAHQIQPFPQNDHSVHSTGAHLASAYPGLCRMKWLEVLVLSLDGIAVHHQGILSALSYSVLL